MRIAPMLASLPQFIRFTIVGAIGFVVDATVVYAVVFTFDAGPYRVRVLSYLCGATTTWYLNRILTFAQRTDQQPGREWLKFVACSAVGGAVNYAAYALYLHYASATPATLLFAVAIGSCAGLCINYLLSRHFVFGQLRTI